MKQILLAFTLGIQFITAQTNFEPVAKETLDQWITEARETNEIATQHLPKFRVEHDDVLKEPNDADRIFDYGRILTILKQPALATATENPMGKSANKIAEEAEVPT